MRRDVRNSSAIKAIISATAAMLAMTTTVGAVPMRVLAAEETVTITAEDAQAQETVTITPEDAQTPVADAEEHPVYVEKKRMKTT